MEQTLIEKEFDIQVKHIIEKIDLVLIDEYNEKTSSSLTIDDLNNEIKEYLN
mgnify:CR=1 FL=1